MMSFPVVPLSSKWHRVGRESTMGICLPWKALSLCLISLCFIISISMATDEDSDCMKSYEPLQNFSEQCENPDIGALVVSVFLRNADGLMQHNASVYIDNPTHAADKSHECIGHPPLNISCAVDMQNHLNFSWDGQSLPGHAHYSISYLGCDGEEAVLESREERVSTPHYHTLIGNQAMTDNVPVNLDDIILRINVSYPDLWYIQTQKWDIRHITKLDPPQIVNATVHGDDLFVQWDLPKTNTGMEQLHCFKYELNVSDEIKAFDSTLHFTEQNIDLTRKYSIQMRVTTTNYCGKSLFWSDWTSVLAVGPIRSPLTDLSNVHIGVIVAIALGLPMILLAVLLLCKFQRVLEKLFPPVPGPSIKIKGLLERDDVTQIVPQKYVEEVPELQFKETLGSEEGEEEENW
ncbi:hypothetical protein ACEWY4_016927 [Coilia grayii]|uniref:Uncharacterized protein n=1 Tax=Coilia grayii TaxID=363190 RepID=A0ABD1JLS2_9TELE